MEHMQHIYPTFERGRIMKKESLWALRDYSYTALALQYQEYADGIISGCKLCVEGNELCIGAGMIKCQGFIYLIPDRKMRVQPTNDMQYLKFMASEKVNLPDYVKYEAEIRLEALPEQSSREIEMCRFKLREGSWLRAEYKDFEDIMTEFDTINLANARWASRSGAALSREITDYYARSVLECDAAGEADVRFAYLALQDKEAVNREVLVDYLRRKRKIGNEEAEWTNDRMFIALEESLRQIRSGNHVKAARKAEKTNRMIILD